MESKLLPDGIKLLIVGQFTVLSFLGCIVLTVTFIAWIFKRFESRKRLCETAGPAPVDADEDAEVAAAIAAALHRHLKSPNP